MFTAQQTIDRIIEIGEFAKTLQPEQVNMDRWQSAPDGNECGTVCCIMGWLAHKEMFGLKMVVAPGCEPHVASPETASGAEGFTAAEQVLFGEVSSTKDWTHRMSAHRYLTFELFSPIGSDLDDPDQQLSQLDTFLARIPKAIKYINDLESDE